MEWLEVLERIEAGEDHRTEFKRWSADLKPVGRAICAFANSEGGVVILGVDDAGAIVGVPTDPEAAQERLTGFLQSGFSAPVSARLGCHEDGCIGSRCPDSAASSHFAAKGASGCVAVGEANAVAHRDHAITGSKVLFEVFSHRIDVTSPGTLPNHMTPESVRAGGHPRSRNELMANLMLVKGVMEQRGRLRRAKRIG